MKREEREIKEEELTREQDELAAAKAYRDTVVADPQTYASVRAASIGKTLETLEDTPVKKPGNISMFKPLTDLKAEYENCAKTAIPSGRLAQDISRINAGIVEQEVRTAELEAEVREAR